MHSTGFRPLRLTLMLAVALLAAGAGACSDDDDNGGAGPDTPRQYNQVQRLGNPLVSEVLLAKRSHAIHGTTDPSDDGTLIAPNDNFRTYAIDRTTATQRWAFSTRDQTWALPAVDARTGRVYAANNYFLGGAPNVFGLNGAAGTERWSAEVNGSVVASPLLTPDHISANIATMRGVFAKYLAYGDGPSGAIMLDNAEWLDGRVK